MNDLEIISDHLVRSLVFLKLVPYFSRTININSYFIIFRHFTVTFVVICGDFMMVCGSLYWFCSGLWWFCGGLWWFSCGGFVVVHVGLVMVVLW